MTPPRPKRQHLALGLEDLEVLGTLELLLVVVGIRPQGAAGQGGVELHAVAGGRVDDLVAGVADQGKQDLGFVVVSRPIPGSSGEADPDTSLISMISLVYASWASISSKSRLRT